MGHIRLGTLPRTRRWKEVIDLVAGGGGDAAAIASATLDAAEHDLSEAANDTGLRHAFWLLTQVPDAATSPDFASALRAVGMTVSDAPSAAELTSAFTQAVDDRVEATKSRSGTGELAQIAAAETLSMFLRDRASTLFGSTTEDVRFELAKAATEVRFGLLARDFFARFTGRYLAYFVSKELPQNIGPNRRFGNLDEARAFSSALDLHCREASKIVEAFAGGWYSKARFEKDLTEARAGRFVTYALKKVRSELRRGQPK